MTYLEVEFGKLNTRVLMKINKYLLYLLVNVVVFSIFLLPRVYRLATYERTMGVVSGFYAEQVPGKIGMHTRSFPVVEFETQKYRVTFLAPDYMKEMVNVGSKALVMYDSDNPEKAYIKNFYGLWGNVFIYLLPFFIIWTICIFHYDLIPKVVKI